MHAGVQSRVYRGSMGSLSEQLATRQLLVSDEATAMKAQAELATEGRAFLPRPRPDGEAWTTYLDRIAYERTAEGLPEGLVPWSNLYLFADDEVVAGLSLRHELTPWLQEVGGHIGYVVRRAWRGRGYASRQLEDGLALAAELGLDRVLISCDVDNHASARVIEKSGGVLEDVRPVPGHPAEPPKRRYWVSAG